MKISRIFLLDLCFVVTFILLCFWPFGIFGPVGNGFPKGDDAQTHAGWVLFIVENWPNTNWYPDWYGGFPVFLSYHPLAYYLWALFAVITGLSVESTLFFFSALSYCLTGIGLYGLVYRITENNDSALLSPLLLITSSGFFGLLSVGGAYTRAFATMFWVLSLWSLVSYIKTGKKRFYLSTIILMSCTFTSNILIGFIAALVNLLILLFCIDGWKKRFSHLLKVFVPVAALSAYFYIPFLVFYLSRFTSFSIRGGHFSIPLPLVLFLGASWQPLLFSLSALLIARYRKVKFDYVASGFLKALMVIVSFFTIYTLIDIPPNLRLFASYDGIYFLPIFLAISAGIIFGGIFSKTSVSSTQLSSIRLRWKKTLSFALLLGIILSSIILYPLLIGYVVDPELESWNNAWYSAQQVINIDPNEMNSRLATDWIHAIRGFHYNYDVPQTGGVHPLGILYPDWDYWFEDAVFASENNWQETNFLLDWNAVKWLLVGNVTHYAGGGEFSKRYGLIEKFLNKPEYYKVKSFVEVPSESYWSGPVYFFEYEAATPLLSLSNAITILVVGGNPVYDEVFRSLALSGYDSRYVIPIRGSAYIDDYSLEDLEKFDVVVLHGYPYRKSNLARKLLEDYVKDGGGLLIEAGDIDTFILGNISPVNKTEKVIYENWNFTYTASPVSDWIDFQYFSPPDDLWISHDKYVPPWASTVLRVNGCSTIIIGELGKGRVAFDGLNIPKRSVVHKNQMESFFFSKLIEWVGNTGEKASFKRVISSESVRDWVMYPGAKETNGSLRISNDTKSDGSSSLEFGYRFNSSSLRGEYVEYKYSPDNLSDWGDAHFLSFWIYGDNSKNQLKVAILAPNRDNYLQTFLEIDWSGWRKIVIPLSKMRGTGTPSLSNVGGVLFVLDEIAVGDGLWHWLYLRDIGILQMKVSDTGSNDEFANPNPEKFVVKVNSSSGILFKESYFQNWHAYLVDSEGQSKSLDIYRAGPDFMYVFIPSDAKFPVEVVFEYWKSQIEWLGYLLSTLAVFALVIYGLGSRFSAPFLPYTIGPSNGLHGRFRRAYELLNLKQNDFLLDIGSSSGAFLQSLSQKGFRSSVGLDINKTNVRRSSRGLVICVASATHLPFRGGTFTKVSMLETFEHIPDPLRPMAFSEVQRILRQDGECVISVPTKSLFGNLDLGIWFKMHQNITESKLLTVLNQFRFRVIEKFQAGSIGHLFDLYIYSRKYSLLRLARIIREPSSVGKIPLWLLKKIDQEYSVNSRFGVTLFVRAKTKAYETV